MGHSKQVYEAHYAKPFRDAEERDRVRESLASIGFGNAQVDHPLTDDVSEPSSQPLLRTKGPRLRAFLSGAYRDRTGDLRLAKPALSQLS